MSVELIFTVAIMGFVGYKIAELIIDKIKESRLLNSGGNSGERGADQGPDSDEKFNLGIKYEKGQELPQDYVLAHMWYNLSASEGNELAKQSRDTLASHMDPIQIAEAQKLAREWTPK